MAQLITINKKPEDVIIIDDNHGGYETGHCYACKASGWIDGLGYPHRAKAPGAHLKHKKSCPMNAVLDDQGDLKKK